MAALTAIQESHFGNPQRSLAEIEELRSSVPAPVLAHFDRLLARGKTGVAAARGGACSGCHIKISSGSLARLSDFTSIHLCDTCGRYLYLVPEPDSGQLRANPTPVRTPRRRKKIAEPTI